MPIIEEIGNGILWLLNNALEPIGKFTIESAMPSFFNLLSSALDGCEKVIDVFKPSLENLWQEVIAPLGATLGEDVLGVIGLVKQAIEELSAELLKHKDDVTNVLGVITNVLATKVAVFRAKLQFMLGFTSGIVSMIVKVLGRIIETFSDIVDFIKALAQGDMRQAFISVANVVVDVVNLVIDIVEGAINSIIRGINNINFDVPDWVPGIGGKHMGFNLTELSWKRVPKLATGGIVDRPTTAMIGEAGREAIVPLENNTEWLDMLAERIGNGNVTIKFDGSLSQLARVLNPVLDAEKSRIGTTLVIE